MEQSDHMDLLTLLLATLEGKNVADQAMHAANIIYAAHYLAREPLSVIAERWPHEHEGVNTHLFFKGCLRAGIADHTILRALQDANVLDLCAVSNFFDNDDVSSRRCATKSRFIQALAKSLGDTERRLYEDLREVWDDEYILLRSQQEGFRCHHPILRQDAEALLVAMGWVAPMNEVVTMRQPKPLPGSSPARMANGASGTPSFIQT